jgi:protein-disulfide isomerase
MSRQLRISLALATALVVAVVGLLLIDKSDGAAEPANPNEAGSMLVRPDSHRLTSVPDGRVTFVEFLDFECEACGALYPDIEKLRKDYGDRVTFVVRYFPMPAHANAERAARAVESAAQQGRFEQMYQRMFETQSQWGEQQSPKDDVFRGFAADLGLDLAAFDAAYNDPATLERVRADVADGRAVGVTGTPTMFLNRTELKPKSYEDLTSALEAALR